MPTFDYDKYVTTGNFIAWDNPGDEVIGTIKERRDGTDYNGDMCMEFVLEINDDGDVATLTASQWMLNKLFTEQRPSVGDRIRVKYTGTETTDRGRTVKQFTLDVQPGQTIPEGPIQKALVDDQANF